jgi:hypothetical protein
VVFVSKKQQKKAGVKTAAAKPEKSVITEAATSLAFGFDEMLGELEAIVVEAEVRLEQEARLA